MLHPAGDSLRLVDPTEGVLSSADVVTGFAQLATTWVWNSDRTRAFVFPTTVLSGAPTTPLGNGTYRIAWGFARIAAGAPGAPPDREGHGRAGRHAVPVDVAVGRLRVAEADARQRAVSPARQVPREDRGRRSQCSLAEESRITA